jgi:phage shock protein PspC (stress-responsive transcriptional regulator)
MIVMPPDPDSVGSVRTVPPSQGEGKVSNASATATLIVGIIVVIIGVTLLFDYYDVFSVTSMWHSFGGLALPVVIILIGGALLFGREQSEPESSAQVPQSGLANGENPGAPLGLSRESDFHVSADGRKLIRSTYDKKIAGVCSGLAEYLNIDSTIVRLIYVLLTLASFGLALILYVVCIFVIPKGTHL